MASKDIMIEGYGSLSKQVILDRKGYSTNSMLNSKIIYSKRYSEEMIGFDPLPPTELTLHLFL